MKYELLDKITQYLDEFAKQKQRPMLAAIIGGEAVIRHGIPRTTVDIDILFHYNAERSLEELSDYLNQKLGSQFDVKAAKKDFSDPLKHDLIVIKDKLNDFIRVDILLVTYKWEVEGLNEMKATPTGELKPLPKPYLIAMKLMSGSSQDNEDIKNLFRTMDDGEKQKTIELAHLIRRDKYLNELLKEIKLGEEITKTKQTIDVKKSHRRHM